MRFDYAPKPLGAFSGMPLVTITLSHSGQQVTVDALVDSGANISILPYELGRQLGFVWEEQHRPVYLGGAYHDTPAYAVVVYGHITGLPEVPLAMAWIGKTEKPIRPILGQTNFFQEFKVSFEGFENEFEIIPKP
ncbi:MAG: hypothetical protein GY801_08210 [bacterium]|nr:hypothetical protein [bacterium]